MYEYSLVSFQETTIINHIYAYLGGAVFCEAYSNISFGGYSMVTFSNNNAGKNGGGINSYIHCSVTYKSNHHCVYIDKKKCE